MTSVINPNFLKLMSVEQRRQFGKAGLTAEEALLKEIARTERGEHNIFLSWLMLKGIPRIHSRMDRRPTIEQGWPDFTVFWDGITLFFEFKVNRRKRTKDLTKDLTQKQEEWIALLREVGFEVFLIDTAKEAIGICKEVYNV
jgi:hypothetical protein